MAALHDIGDARAWPWTNMQEPAGWTGTANATLARPQSQAGATGVGRQPLP